MELNYTTDYWLTTINTYIKNTYINFNKKKNTIMFPLSIQLPYDHDHSGPYKHTKVVMEFSLNFTFLYNYTSTS
jgi:hypothetical protein